MELRHLGWIALALWMGACGGGNRDNADAGSADDAGDSKGVEVSAGTGILRLPNEGHVVLSVTVERTGSFTGDLVVEVTGLPAGVAADAKTVPAGATTANVTLEATSSAAPGGPTPIVVRASSPDESGVSAEVERALYVAGAPGSADVSFGTGGIAYVPLEAPFQLGGVSIDPSGRVVVAGSQDGPSGEGVLARFLANGELDPDFGDGGLVITRLGGDSAPTLYQVLARADRVLLRGAAYFTESDPVTRLRQFTDAGLVDTAYGTNGDVENVGAIVARGEGLLMLSGGTVTALDASGAPDPSFDMGSLPSFQLRSAAVAEGGNVVLGGGNADCQIARLHPDGSVDQAFGTDGVLSVPAAADYTVNGMWVMPQSGGGGFAVCSMSSGPSLYTPLAFLIKFTATGTLDPSFSGDGVIVVGENVKVFDAVADAGSRPVLFARESDATDLLLWRFLPNGLPDTDFGDGGTKSLTELGDVDQMGYEPIVERLVVCSEDNAGGILTCGRFWL